MRQACRFWKRWTVGCLSFCLGLIAAGKPAAACDKSESFAFYPKPPPSLEWNLFASGPAETSSTWSRDARGLLSDPSSCQAPPSEILRTIVSASLSRGMLVLAGEIHDNPDQHAFRAYLLGWRSAPPGIASKPPALVFEHIRIDQQPALDQFAEFNAKARRPGHSPGNSGDLFRFLEWDKSGWPDKKIFEPLFSAAIAAKLPILPGDPSRERVRAIARGGDAALTDDERQRFKLGQPLAARLQDALLDELEASHCGLMPKTAFVNMAVAQRYRDAHLADALAKAAGKHGSAILLAGNGHVRKDRGVPYYLRQMAPDRKAVSVMLLEVEEGRDDPAAYIPRDPQGKPAADYILFTPRAERKDPCAEMRARFGQKK